MVRLAAARCPGMCPGQPVQTWPGACLPTILRHRPYAAAPPDGRGAMYAATARSEGRIRRRCSSAVRASTLAIDRSTIIWFLSPSAVTSSIRPASGCLKRGHVGTFLRCSQKHLDRNVAGFSGTHNDREASTTEQMRDVVKGLTGEHVGAVHIIGLTEQTEHRCHETQHSPHDTIPFRFTPSRSFRIYSRHEGAHQVNGTTPSAAAASFSRQSKVARAHPSRIARAR